LSLPCEPDSDVTVAGLLDAYHPPPRVSRLAAGSAAAVAGAWVLVLAVTDPQALVPHVVG